MADPSGLLVVLVVLFSLIGLPLIAVSRENSLQTTSRASFLVWAFVLVVPGTIMESSDDILVRIACVVAFVAYLYPFQQAVTRRAREAGYSRAMAYWSVAPIVGTIIIVLLALAPPSDAASR